MTESSDTLASRRALLAGALGVGGIGAVAMSAGSADAALAAAVPTVPGSDFYLTLSTIAGESQSDRYRGAIELLTFSFGDTSSSTAVSTGGGAGVGKVRRSPFVFVSRASIASPRLFLACATGRHTSATLDAVGRGNRPQSYLTVTMGGVVVTSYQVAPGETDGFPLDVVRLDYRTLSLTQRRLLPDGTLEPVTTGFDFQRNVPL